MPVLCGNTQPVGALNPDRLAYLRDRAEQLAADSQDTSGAAGFLYGTHYSTVASVLYYMCRLEPFTSLHIEMQSGRFDAPDRLFRSFADTWRNVNTSRSDFKELVPEFFYSPEVLLNSSDLPLGTTQAGEVVGDVELPPWASSADDFIRQHREALECPLVSSQLHLWIDLVFGSKQNGQVKKVGSPG